MDFININAFLNLIQNSLSIANIHTETFSNFIILYNKKENLQK